MSYDTIWKVPPKVVLFFCLSTVLSGFILLSCQTTSPGIEIPGMGQTPKDAPGWIDRFPDEPEFYIGIGSSNTGDKSEDQEKARAKALSNLAASISTQIQSEQSFLARENSEGESYEEAEVVINETVNQNLRQVEQVDSYYAEEIGYWFYVRLNKKTWQDIQDREMKDIANRVLAMVDPVLDDSDTEVSGKIATLWKAWDIVAKSPYAGLIQTSVAGEAGVLIDLLERQMQRHIDSLSLNFKPATLITEIGRPESIVVEVKTTYKTKPGTFYINLVYKDRPDDVVLTVVTEDSGLFQGEVELKNLDVGKTSLTGIIDFASMGADLKSVPRQVVIPEKDVLVDVQQIKAGLTVTIPEDTEVANLFNTIQALLSNKLPLKIGRPSSEDRYLLDVTIGFRNAPKNEYDIFFVYATVFISVVKDSRTLFSYESEEFKGGGLDTAQGQKKAMTALLEGLEEADEFADQIRESLAYD